MDIGAPQNCNSVPRVPRFTAHHSRVDHGERAADFCFGKSQQNQGTHGWPGAAVAAPGARIGRRARGTRRHDVPVVTALARRPVSHPLRAPPAPATRQGHGDWLAAARHRRVGCDVAERRAVWNPLHPRRSSACAQGVAGHGRPAKACHDRDVVSGRPRAQALRRGPARQGRRGCGVPSLWFLSLGKQRKGPAPGRVIRPKLSASKVRNPSEGGD